MKGSKYIFKKEMDRVLKDKKMIFSVFILPAAMMIGIFFLMNYISQQEEQRSEEHKPSLYIQNAPNEFASFMAENQADLSINEDTAEITYHDSTEDMKSYHDDLKNGDLDLIVEFPQDFATLIQAYKEGRDIPQIKTFYNPSEQYSASARELFVGEVLGAFKQVLLAERIGDLNRVVMFNVDTDNADMEVLDEQKATGQLLGSLLPYLITIVLFAGAMSLCMDTFTGEKERGTMASMLIAPIRREEIVFGKVSAIALMSLISAGIQLVAMIAGAPMMLAQGSGGEEIDLAINFTPTQIVQLIVVMITLTFLYVSLVSAVSIFAKDIKEAGTLVTPCYLVVVVAGMLSMFGENTRSMVEYAIPIYNSSFVLKGIMANEITMTQFGLSVAVTVAAVAAAVIIIAKAFNSEKVMFNA